MSVTTPRVQGSPRLEWRCAPLPTSTRRQGKLRSPRLLVLFRSLPVHLRPRSFHAVSLSLCLACVLLGVLGPGV